MELTNQDYEKALSESLRLQAIYAEQLNMYDGGKRMIFHTVSQWIERLKGLGIIKEEKPARPLK